MPKQKLREPQTGISWKTVFTITLGIVTLVGVLIQMVDFFMLQSGDQATARWFLTGGTLLMFLALVSGWVGFSTKRISRKGLEPNGILNKTQFRYPYFYRRVAYTILVLTAVSVAYSGLLYWRYQQGLSNKLIILVTSFDGPEEVYGISDEITAKLNADFESDNAVKIVKATDVITPLGGSLRANEIGKSHQADIVIWGWYRPTSNPNITIYIENLNPEQFSFLNKSETLRPNATLQDLESFSFQKQAGLEASSLVSFLVGFIDYRKGDYLTANKRFDSALSNLSSTPLLIPNWAEIYYYRGNTYAYLIQYQRAIKDYDQAIKINSQFADAYNNRGIAYAALSEYQRSIENYDQAIQINWQFVDAYNNRGIAYAALGEYQRSIENYDQAIQINPQFPDAYNNRGLAYFSLLQYDKAVENYSIAIALNPNYTAVYKNRGEAYQKLGKLAEADADFKKYEISSFKTPTPNPELILPRVILRLFETPFPAPKVSIFQTAVLMPTKTLWPTDAITLTASPTLKTISTTVLSPVGSPLPLETITPLPTDTVESTEIAILVLSETPAPTYTRSRTNTPKPTETHSVLLSPTLEITKTLTPTPTPDWLMKTYQENSNNSITWILGILFTYLLGISALLIAAWRFGSNIFSRSWLTKLASTPLLITPGVGRWALFLGYKKRLLDQPDVKEAANKYFGLPAIDPDGKNILPELIGKRLDELIAQKLDFQKPVVIVAKGGGGKTTFLAHWSYLALNNKLPAQLKGYQPVFITPAFYGGNLVAAITNVLRERDGVAIDKNMMQAQLESGKYLILFDGISEIEGDQARGLQEVLRTAGSADYRNCRFLITTRPGLNISSETAVFQLQPLTADVILDLLPLYELDAEQKYRVKGQLKLFGTKPIEPLLFSMILGQTQKSELSTTRSELYERYFRRLLKIEDDAIWQGWNVVLGEFAKWFTLDTGHRGVGLIRETLVDKISCDDLLTRIKKYYGLSVKSELDLLEDLKSARVMQDARRWRFVHDTFEEYFAACYIISYINSQEKLPNLGLWSINDAQTQSFVGVVEFIKEMADVEILKILLDSNLPQIWRDILEPGIDNCPK